MGKTNGSFFQRFDFSLIVLFANFFIGGKKQRGFWGKHLTAFKWENASL